MLIKKRGFLLLFLCIVNVFLLIDLDIRSRGFSKIFFSSVNVFYSSVGYVVNKFTDFTGAIRLNTSLKKENTHLKQQITQFQHQLKSTSILEHEVQYLRTLLQFRYSIDYDILPAQVISSMIQEGNANFMLNRGQDQGIQKGMVVCGVYKQKLVLIGKITFVTKNQSMFQSILAHGITTPVTTSVSNQKGLLQGGGVFHESFDLFFDAIYQSRNIIVGEEVLLHEFSTLFPQRIPIGTVVSINTNDRDLLIKAEIRPYITPEHLDSVFVLVGRRKE